MAEFATLVSDVKGKIQLDESIYPIEEIRRQVELAHHLYFGSIPVESLTDQECVLLVTKSWADICRIMATRFALHFPIRTQNGETDESKVVDNYLKIADRLDSQVSSLEEELGIDETYVVKHSKMIKRDTYNGRFIENNLRLPSPADSIDAVRNVVATSNVAGYVSIKWSPSSSTNFNRYQVWGSRTSGIFDESYLSNTNPGVKEGSTLFYTSYINHRTGSNIKVTESGVWYFVVLLVTELGAVVPSSEVEVSVL